MADKLKSPPTDEQILNATRLVRYEIAMLRQTASELAGPATRPWAVQNALVESFVTHLRLLCYFFWEERSFDDVVAQDFMPKHVGWETVRVKKPQNIDDARGRGNKDVAHLTYSRLQRSTAEEKAWDVEGLMQTMEDVIDTFMAHARNDLLEKLQVEQRVVVPFREGSRMGTVSLDRDAAVYVVANLRLGSSVTSGRPEVSTFIHGASPQSDADGDDVS